MSRNFYDNHGWFEGRSDDGNGEAFGLFKHFFG